MCFTSTENREEFFFFFSSRRRHTRLTCDWSSDVCSSDLNAQWRAGLATYRNSRCGRIWRNAADGTTIDQQQDTRHIPFHLEWREGQCLPIRRSLPFHVRSIQRANAHRVVLPATCHRSE